ncbi:diacylglycerol kinase family protein [Polluticoccus soli]|uniref:diacylglycerol kinase family protein n=1 Tax=Polluticoccus soli TaxID=3034150 RepID=UPI0023E34C60|nr:diacylglycerol kinase family protein [Flavipsychrobacter sp. JY13-12]
MPNFFDNVRYAVAGIRSFFSTEQNGRAQGIIALLVVTAGFLFRITAMEWVLVLGCIALVICLEMVNSAIEKVCNLITSEYNPAIKVIKDIAAGAVLLAAIISAVIGAIIFLPYINSILTIK